MNQLKMVEDLLRQLRKCDELIAKGGASSTGDIAWLNSFCASFLQFASEFQSKLPDIVSKELAEGNIHIETIFLCLTQIVTCITHLERILNTESARGVYLPMTRMHFLDRINWCLRRLHASLVLLAEQADIGNEIPLEEHTFVELLDFLLDQLEAFRESGAEIDGDEVRLVVQHILRHALAFANVAVEPDKKSLSSLCEKLLSECTAFQQAIELSASESNAGDRKLAASSLEHSVCCLETFLNEALLRLVFTSLLDVDELSIEKLKHAMLSPDSTLEQLIADFDANMDRIQQIGVFAIGFSPDVKTKTIVRSCLASLESLDAAVVPAFQAQRSNTLHAELLERHFNEEVLIFRNIIQEIIDSQALMNNYLDMLAQSIHLADKSFPKEKLLQVANMGNVLIEHFQLRINYQELCKDEKRLHTYKDFVLILRECQAILKLAMQVDVEPKRVLKRLKILYSVLAKLRDAFAKRSSNENAQRVESSIAIANNTESHYMFESLGASPSIQSIVRRPKEIPRQPGGNRTNRQGSISKHKRESLRRTLFKRQAVKPQNSMNSDLISFQFSEILSIS